MFAAVGAAASDHGVIIIDRHAHHFRNESSAVVPHEPGIDVADRVHG
jgi:hypothetical protein